MQTRLSGWWRSLKANSKPAARWWRNRLRLARERGPAVGFCSHSSLARRQRGLFRRSITLLREHNALGSSQQQFELLTARLTKNSGGGSQPNQADEFVLVLPMGADSELLAATTAEQIARRLHFSPEAINQIKTAIVEACINASEHSLSPERKIYQRFRVENDKLVITIASRGIVPSNIARRSKRITNPQPKVKMLRIDSRRGWGLKLIQTLMDEVEFERVDEGTSLRMVKYLGRRGKRQVRQRISCRLPLLPARPNCLLQTAGSKLSYGRIDQQTFVRIVWAPPRLSMRATI